jgi:hypothetical protein
MFLVLAVLVAATLFDQRVAEWGNLAGSKRSPAIQRAIDLRGYAYGAFCVLMVGACWFLQEQPSRASDYPPKPAPFGGLLERELALAPGARFRGRLLTIVPAGLQGPSNAPIFYDAVARYRRNFGNDFWVDPLAFNIPTMNEFSHFTSPFAFAFARIFFGRKDDQHDRTTVVYSRFDLRIARLLGVRMIATDALAIPGGTLAYEAKASDAELRIFRIEDVNVGQYSPRRTRHIQTATDAIAAIKSANFDPKLDAVVESEISADLVPATSAVLTVDRGPAFVVRATTPGRSLAVLPFEYSRCLEMTTNGGRAQLLPINLLQTGLLFEGSVEARIVYRFGLFHDPNCRAEDLRRADTLNLKEALIRNDRAVVVRKRPRLW